MTDHDLRIRRAAEHAATALELAADLNLAGDGTTLPSTNLTDGSRGPWGLAFDCAGACLADVFVAEKVTFVLDRAINNGEHDPEDLLAYAEAWDAAAQPDTIHGYPVIESTDYVERPGCMPTRAILVRKSDDEYVTALQLAPLGVPADEWLSGHYFSNLGRAVEDYNKRVANLTR